MASAPPAKPVFDEQRAGIVNRRIDPRRNVRAHLLVWGIDLEFFAHALAQLDFGDCGHKGKYRAPEASGAGLAHPLPMHPTPGVRGLVTDDLGVSAGIIARVRQDHHLLVGAGFDAVKASVGYHAAKAFHVLGVW